MTICQIAIDVVRPNPQARRRLHAIGGLVEEATELSGELRHEIVVGHFYGGKMQRSKNAGLAIRRGQETFYSLRLYMFPGIVYFLCKNHGENPNYTLYSKIVRNDGAIKFQKPVGAARLRDDLTTHLEIRFNLLDRRLFMSLFPAH